jgi:hypothetical protein
MTAGWRGSTRLLGAIAVAMLLTENAAPASAQTLVSPANRPAAAAQPAKPARQRAPANKPAEQGTDYWAINTDVGKYTNAARANEKPATPTRDLGRVPLQTAPGSVGFSSQPVRSGQFSDGRTVPGLDRYTQDPQSYVGLSVSVTSTNNSFPIPLFPRNEW